MYEIAKDFGAAVPPSKESLSQDNLTAIVAAVPEPIVMDKYNSDWDPMFPFSLVSPLSHLNAFYADILSVVPDSIQDSPSCRCRIYLSLGFC